MFSSIAYALLCLNPILFKSETWATELFSPSLTLYSPGEPDYTDVLVRREGDNLTLVCESKGDNVPRIYVWNYMPANNDSVERSYTTEPKGLTLASKLTKPDLQLSDSGHYMCSAPPFSVTKYILVQTKGSVRCSRGAFWCGTHCVLASYVCDGFNDCRHGEDEAVELCELTPCARPDKLNCSSGRCISEAACCRSPSALCKQPSCCEEHRRYYRFEGSSEVEFPPLFEDRHAPDDYGFIQSTIYTVTACALIFMIAVVLLVSAICKMHMKRAALRSYAHAERATRQHYNMQYAQAHRFPPCYEASRLLEQEARRDNDTTAESPGSPTNESLCNTACSQPSETAPESEQLDDTNNGFGLARLSAIFSSRYRQVPTQCLDVEMTDVRPSSLNSSPTRNRTRLDNYRSPTYCDLNTDFFFNPETSNCGRDLNYMATPVEFYRRRTLRNNLDRILDQINRPRPLTLQLGRFQLSIPRLGRRASLDRRPDTPNVAELTIDDLDFVRLNSNDTYTLNGRTIRLLGANFENYPVLENSTTHPPPYTEAMRYKLYGPPPEYLSRDRLNTDRTENEEQARTNIEMPPCYDELASGVDGNSNVTGNLINVTGNLVNLENVTGNVANEVGNLTNLTSNAANVTGNVTNNTGNSANAGNGTNVAGNVANATGNVANTTGNCVNGVGNIANVTGNVTNNVTNGSEDVTNASFVTNATRNLTNEASNVTNVNSNAINSNNVITENLSSVIDNLPAIDSDVNANETDNVIYNVNNAVNNNSVC